MSQTRRRAHSGFSIVELLIAIIIITILATILIPLIAKRTEDARNARALNDLENIVEAQQRASVDTGYYVRLFALNDTYGGTLPFTRPNPPNGYIDGLGQYDAAGGYYQNIDNFFIDPQSNTFLTPPSRNTTIRLRINNNETNYGPSELYRWGGPYLSFTRDNNLASGVVAADGIPDDPWGNNYLFFTRLGLILEPQGSLETNSVALSSNGNYTSGGPYDVTGFDRPTIASTGPDGTPGDATSGATTFGDGDDLFRSFGR
ncbi:MAG: prepilin-type N-terminal cleavage/methylation domain-containing protein [Candidatus Sumerlaeia bacterium]|nr:prepilin-type N-terminal cleavage/methylation domain-containing protein [Candidatus Sumerlaeia bacterium]